MAAPDRTAAMSGLPRATGRTMVPAVGGERLVPAPDPIARDYLLLALRMEQRIPGIVDGYFGPADLKAQVDLEPLPAPGRLRDDARALRARVETEVADAPRRRWLSAQLDAIEVQARALAGDPLPYEEHVARCFEFVPRRRPETELHAAARALDTLLPGPGPIATRLEAWDARFIVPPERLPALADLLVERFRGRARSLFGLPEGEALRVGLVRNQPWSGYNWYDGGFRSRVDINTDVPVRVTSLVHVLAHETYPGHHLEHAWKEADQVLAAGRLESSVLLINAPECLISEGLADLGHRFASPPEAEAELLVELFVAAGLPLAVDPVEAREAAALDVAMAGARASLAASDVNAALMRHADGASHDEVLAYLRETGLLAPDRAAQRLSFIEHPLWRTYVFVYSEGEALLRRWLEIAPPDERAARFGRLLHEQLTPGAIEDELAAIPG
jgi:hypothetical protein